ncbi:MAG: hypothetical protein KC457_28430 [Myxococcales bacterium]|nr:hypothetical protein [Myxococcales bacterium]
MTSPAAITDPNRFEYRLLIVGLIFCGLLFGMNGLMHMLSLEPPDEAGALDIIEIAVSFGVAFYGVFLAFRRRRVNAQTANN